MLKVSAEVIDELEKQRPGIGAMIARFECAVLPVCSHCGSADTASVPGGVVGYTINLAAATTRVKVYPGMEDKIFCNACQKFFSTVSKAS